QVHRARLLGTDAPGATGRYAVVPVDVNGFHAAQADMQGAVDRRTGALEHTDYGEWLVVVLVHADRRHAVGHHQHVVHIVMLRLGHFGTEHHLERVIGEGAALAQFQVLTAGVLVMAEVVASGAHYPVAAVRIPQRNGDGPFHPRVIGVVLVAVPTNVVGG